MTNTLQKPRGRYAATKGSKKATPEQEIKAQKKFTLKNVLLFIVAVAAIGLLLYPEAANWFAQNKHNSEISGYIRSVDETGEAKRKEILEAAYAYNDQLEPGPLTDPYITEDQDQVIGSDVYKAYENLLRVSGSASIGTLNYPDIDVTLPVYHGTEDKTISKGVGHLYGTSLPVGGPSTRSVLTAHSGLKSAKLLTPLHKAKVGDVFWISVLGEDHYYRVEETETVLPGETESLRIIEGEDWVTLFTCTPIGVNSHRFMVHAIRIDDKDKGEFDGTIQGDGVAAGFPWWIVYFMGGSTLAGLFLFYPGRGRKKDDEAQSAVQENA